MYRQKIKLDSYQEKEGCRAIGISNDAVTQRGEQTTNVSSLLLVLESTLSRPWLHVIIGVCNQICFTPTDNEVIHHTLELLPCQLTQACILLTEDLHSLVDSLVPSILMSHRALTSFARCLLCLEGSRLHTRVLFLKCSIEMILHLLLGQLGL